MEKTFIRTGISIKSGEDWEKFLAWKTKWLEKEATITETHPPNADAVIFTAVVKD